MDRIDTEDFWSNMALPDLPAAVYNTNYEIAHRVTPRRPLHNPWPPCRRCGGADETTEHVVYHCPAIAGTIWPLLTHTLARLSFRTVGTDAGTFILSLGLTDAEGPATILAFTRHLILSHHTGPPIPATLWPALGLSNLEASLKHHIENLFLRASRHPATRADLRLRTTFENTWTRTPSQEGLLSLDWNTYDLRWHWTLT
jgi:hypothetical protein